MGRQSLSEEVITKIFELYLNDKSFQEISAEVGVSCATVKKYIKMGELDTIKAEMKTKEETKKEPAEKKSSSRKKQVNKKQSETNKKDTVAKQTKSRKEEPMVSTVKSSKKEESKTISQKLLDTTSIQARLRRNKNTKVGILMPRSFESKEAKLKKEAEFDKIYGEGKWFWMDREEFLLRMMVKVDDMRLEGEI